MFILLLYRFLFIEGKNLSVALVEEGLASVHFSAEKTPYFRPLQIAEDNAKARRDKIWMNYEDTKDEVKPEDDKAERHYEPKTVIVTEVTPELHIFVQFTDEVIDLNESSSHSIIFKSYYFHTKFRARNWKH